jgi:hypothetical protein
LSTVNTENESTTSKVTVEAIISIEHDEHVAIDNEINDGNLIVIVLTVALFILYRGCACETANE